MATMNLRPELTAHLQQRLRAFTEGFRQNMALIGPAGSGKTFQLQAALAHPPAGLSVISCALYRESRSSLLNRLRGAILQAALAEEPHQSLEGLLERAQSRLPATVGAIRSVDELLARRLYSEAFTRTLDVIPTLVQEQHRPCVLILDEFLLLETLGFTHAFHELGKRVMTWPSVLFIVSSSSPYRARVILRERLQLLFGQFELLSLDAPDVNAAAMLVQRELHGVRGARGLSPFLVRWLGAYPRYLTIFVKRLRELAALERAGELSEALFFQTAWDLLGSPEGMLHQWCRSQTEQLVHVRHGSRAMEALLQIAEGARTTTELGHRMGRAGLSGALEALTEHDLAQRKGACWLIPDPVLRCWLTAVVSPEQAGAARESAQLRARFEQYLSGTWKQWIYASQLTFPEQVARLFTSFRDDTICLDSKTGRLPRFDTIRTHRPERPEAGTYLIAEGQGKRWCCAIQEGLVDENTIATFESFCRGQAPKPSRKIVVSRAGVEQNARLLAKASNMWVWTRDELGTLTELYG